MYREDRMSHWDSGVTLVQSKLWWRRKPLKALRHKANKRDKRMRFIPVLFINPAKNTAEMNLIKAQLETRCIFNQQLPTQALPQPSRLYGVFQWHTGTLKCSEFLMERKRKQKKKLKLARGPLYNLEHSRSQRRSFQLAHGATGFSFFLSCKRVTYVSLPSRAPVSDPRCR